MVIKNTEQKDFAFIDQFDGVNPIRIFGHQFDESDGLPLFISRSSLNIDSPRSLEEYLLEHKTTPWQRFRAKHFGSCFLLGSFKKVGHVGYMGWFLFWCNNCRRFSVNYKRGFDQRLDCESCLFKSYP